ncbi:MAG: ATP-binding protein [Draconibacterium sp.]|nr:ATP-binding protein [Draconibacterium sp.]
MTKIKFSKHYILIPLIPLVFFLFFFLIYKDIKDRTINEFHNEQLILARTASQGITSFFDDYKSNLSFLSQLTNIIEFTDDGKTLMSGFYENHKNYVAAITRVDARGIILYTYPFNQSVIGDDISSQEHVRQVIATQQPVISDVFKSVQGYLAIAMHIPVFNNSAYVGSLAILIPIDKLGEHYLGNIKVRGTGNVWLMSEMGIELFCPVSGHTGKHFLENTQNDAVAVELLEKIKTEYSGTAESIHQSLNVNDKIRYDNNYITFYHVPLGNTFWTILISCRERDIYAEVSRLRNRLILIFSLFFIVISYYFYSLIKVRIVLIEEKKREKAEKTLRESQEKFRTIFNESPIGIELFKSDGAFVNANQASLNMFGIPDVSEVQNFNLFDGTTLDNDKKEKLRKGEPITYQAIFNFEKVKELQQYKTSKSGKAHFDYIITPLLNPEDNRLDGYLMHVQDISERKRSEEELIKAKEKAEESDRLKSAFLANMSHEIRTPMNGILGFSELLKTPGLSGEEQQAYIQIIEKSGARMLNTINDIVDISKIEAGLIKPDITESDVNEQMEYIYNFFKPEVEAKGMTLNLNATLSQKVVIQTDREKLYAILTNLMKNAIKYSEKGSIEFGYNHVETLHATSLHDNSYLQFFVKDTGIGIPKERQDAIFERFIQADIENRNARQGSGLGLAITKSYVEMLGGKIWLESEEGIGSTFHFTLPRITVKDIL